MEIELCITGYFFMTIYNIDKKEVTEEEKKVILENLKNGTYVIGINSKTISALSNLQDPIYTFDLEVQDGTEYDFNEIES